MNKKILFLILGAIALPAISYAINTPAQMFEQAGILAQAIGGSVVIIGWVITGILYLTAAGKPDKLETAKKALIAVIIGTLLVVIAKLGYDVIKGLLNPIIGGGAPAAPPPGAV